METLTEREIDALPRIKRMRIGNEPVPRSVLHVAKRLEPTPEDIAWATEVINSEGEALR